ncbi:MAG: hypothetical protein HA495_08245 [Thaumarchaeota archaeon]|nr:hypothetical protein [Nitrososphaerota archaeon]
MYLSEDEQKLIAKILEKDVKLLKPKYSPTKGFVYDIDGEIGLELSKFLSLANGLVEKDFLQRKFYKKIPTCPNCGSQRLLFTFVCPFCKSSNWSKGKAIQHLTSTCNYMGFESEFVDNVCPNCGQELKSARIDEGGGTLSLPVDYKVYDVYYKCNSCERFFEHPAVSALCLDCSVSSDFDSLNWIDLYTYEPSPALQKLESALFLTTKIKSELVRRGYTIKESQLLGKSGLPHEFDIVAAKGDVQVAIDVSAESDKKQRDLLLSGYVKSQDIENTNYYFVSTEGLTQEEKKITETFNIKSIEKIKDAKEILDKIEDDSSQKVKSIEKQS